MVVACTPPVVPRLRAEALPFNVDTLRASAHGAGGKHHFLYGRSGPWAIHVLDVAIDRCHTAVAVKGGSSAVGRTKTSVPVAGLRDSYEVIGGVTPTFFV
jgi:hypothetical protein